MKPDRYTKAVLTIIAGALVWICVRDLIPPVHAGGKAPGQEMVTLARINDREPIPVKIVAIERVQWSEKTAPFGEIVHRSLPWQRIEVVTR
jgi:hypothetical protein